MPKRKNPDEKGLSQGVVRELITSVNIIINDDRLGPNRRLLATFFKTFLCAYRDKDEELKSFAASVIFGEFVAGKSGFKVHNVDSQFINKEGERSKLEIAAMDHINQAFDSIKSGMEREGFLPNVQSGEEGD